MRVPLSWLKEYVDLTLPIEQMTERLTLAGLEVGGIERIGDWWDSQRILVGQIVEVKQHPNADRLTLPLVDYGGQEPLQVVTGAPNIHVGDSGQKVALALTGAKLIDGHAEERRFVTLKPGNLRGVRSEGMVCSEKELDISEAHEGILILPDDAPVGMPLTEYLGDTVLTIEITPNIARCLSVIGVAREVAALTGAALHVPEPTTRERGGRAAEQAEVEIADPDLCNRYCAAIIRGIQVGPSPFWMQRRLTLCGIRPINSIVDITNYVMLEWGQPLHAFDYDLLHGRSGGTPPAERPAIIVRRAGEGERMVTLDGEERLLDQSILLITDGAGPVAVAGVMGGLHSEIEPTTRNVLLEAATFDMIGNRIASQRLHLASEAATRFGRGVPASLAIIAARRAADLMDRIAGGEVQQGIVDAYPVPQPRVTVRLRPERARQVIGADVGAEEMRGILESLGFAVDASGERWQVVVPTHRLDITIEEDLFEEIARVYGYQRLPASRLRDELPPLHDSRAQRGEELLRDLLVACGLQEAMTYSLVDRELEAPLQEEPVGEAGYVRVLNPLSSDRQWLRRSLLPALLLTARDNLRHTASVRLFEIGHAFLPRPERELPDEPLRLGIVMVGSRGEPSWLEETPEAIDFLDLKGVLDEVAQRLRLPLQYERAQRAVLHPGRAATVTLEGVGAIGHIGELHPRTRAAYGLPEQRVCVCELDLDEVIRRWVEYPAMQPVSRFPAVLQDVAVVLAADVSAARVTEEIWRAGRGLLSDVALFDVYAGEGIPASERSLAFRLSYQLQDRTPGEDEVRRMHQRIVQRLQSQLGARLRE
ncbi:MAG: phenylalanine--tRNA ligase subunit beta [Anaerolineae bacterium]